jgi:hypothetical protein
MRGSEIVYQISAAPTTPKRAEIKAIYNAQARLSVPSREFASKKTRHKGTEKKLSVRAICPNNEKLAHLKKVMVDI